MGFSEEDFTNVLREIDNPDLKEYEFFVESHGVSIHRLYSEKSGLYQYKVIGCINVDPETCVEVYMDLAYRKSWDSFAAELGVVCQGEPEVVYWEVAYPWPMSHRDYVYIRQKKEFDVNGQKYCVVLGRSAKKEDLKDSKCIPEKKGIVRVDDLIQCIVITSDGKGGTKAFMHYYDDPKGSIPTWLVNWAASKGVPKFLGQMETACNTYKEYKRSLKPCQK